MQVELPQSFQFKIFSEHDRPRDQTENPETDGDDLADGIAAQENLNEVGCGEKKRHRKKRVRVEEELERLRKAFNGKRVATARELDCERTSEFFLCLPHSASWNSRP